MYLTKHWEKTWPNALPGIYIKCYQLMRKHYPIDFKMCTTESNFKSLVEESDSVLLYGELCLEHTAASSDKGTKESKYELNSSKYGTKRVKLTNLLHQQVGYTTADYILTKYNGINRSQGNVRKRRVPFQVLNQIVLVEVQDFLRKKPNHLGH